MGNQNIVAIENKIKSYYWRKKEYERLTNNLNRLVRHRSEIQRDIDSSNISFGISIPSTDYTKDRVQNLNTTSPQEREIDKAFAKLEQALIKTEDEILETKNEMRSLEASFANIEFIINSLNQEAQNFLIWRYKYLKSNYFISQRLHLSETGVRRLREKTLDEFAKWFLWFEKNF